jgi:CRP-like cAMP-binding protein
MARKVKSPSFDANLLLATAGRGRTKLEYRSEGVVFSQGDAADSIFYVLRGKIKIVVTSQQGREAVIVLLGEGEKRLARALLLLANFGKEGRPEPIIAKISQETLAEMIGTTRPRVSFFMNKFRKLGFIEYNGRLQVHSSLLSVVLRD